MTQCLAMIKRATILLIIIDCEIMQKHCQIGVEGDLRLAK